MQKEGGTGVRDGRGGGEDTEEEEEAGGEEEEEEEGAAPLPLPHVGQMNA